MFEMRHCTTCGQDKPAAEFPKDRTHNRCKECKSDIAKRSYRRAPEKAKARAKRWRQEHLERSREHKRRSSATYRTKHRDRRNAAARKRYHDELGKWRAYFRNTARRKKLQDPQAGKKRYAANRDFYLARAKAYAAAHPGIAKRRYRANPEHYRAKGRKFAAIRRARKLGATVGVIDLAAIMARDKMRCHICRKKVKDADLHFDHVIPLAKGGEHSAQNLAVAHARCNLQKQAKRLTLF